MSLIHQVEAVAVLLCLGVGFHQSSEYQWTGMIPDDYKYRTKTHWNQIILHTLKNWLILNGVFIGLAGLGLGVQFIWDWLGAL